MLRQEGQLVMEYSMLERRTYKGHLFMLGTRSLVLAVLVYFIE
jgi:hypothetical protein